MSEPCFCLADITLATDTNDNSCMNGDVVSSGTPVAFSPAPVPDGPAGFFGGLVGETYLNVSRCLPINSSGWDCWLFW